MSLPLPLRAQAELERRRRYASGAVVSKYRTFQTTYCADPVAFIHDCVDWRDDCPAPYQEEILADLVAHRRMAVRGPHGLGKTCDAALAVHWFALTNDGEDWKIITTASAWRQLTKYLWPEIAKWRGRLRWDKIGRQPYTRDEALTLALNLGNGSAFAVASDNSDFIEGAHAARLLYVFDEAKAIPVKTWDAAEGAFASGECYALAISTPGEPQGRFYDIHSRKPGFEDWRTRHVTLEEAITARRISRAWAEQRCRQWGEDSAVYQNRVLGEFASSEESGVIPLAWVEAANLCWHEWADAGRPLPEQMTAVGVDVGRGGDKSVLALRWDDLLSELRRDGKADTMALTGRVVGVLRAHGGRAVVDVIGVGAGVVDRLREQDFDVFPFNAGERTDARDSSGELGFVNVRAAAWWGLRERLDPANGSRVALPPDDTLTGDLTAPHWTETSSGKIQVEAKEQIRERLDRSPDDGDAVVMAFFSDSRKVQIWV